MLACATSTHSSRGRKRREGSHSDVDGMETVVCRGAVGSEMIGVGGLQATFKFVPAEKKTKKSASA